ncbi:ALP1-like protein [Tanacetum coccineum]
MGFRECLEALIVCTGNGKIVRKNGTGNCEAGANNDITILNNSLLFDDLLDDIAPVAPFEVNGVTFQQGYYLANGIYPQWLSFVKSFSVRKNLEKIQYLNATEGARQDVERAFGVFKDAGIFLPTSAQLETVNKLRRVIASNKDVVDVDVEQEVKQPQTFISVILPLSGHENLAREMARPMASCDFIQLTFVKRNTNEIPLDLMSFSLALRSGARAKNLVDRQIEEGRYSQLMMEARIDTRKKLLEVENIDDAQKLEKKWEAKRDENYKFFHYLMKQQRRQQTLAGIMGHYGCRELGYRANQGQKISFFNFNKDKFKRFKGAAISNPSGRYKHSSNSSCD